LEAISGSMLRLAENDLAAPLPRLQRADELGEMSDALRVFKANALRRQRLEQDKQVLHTRLREAYGQLRKDLEAAAAIQNTLLPEPSVFGAVGFRGLYLPSSVIAGDTYNVLERPDGTVGFFQLDVAGHGAPAALMSVASHHALSQALLKQVDGIALSDIASQINAEWSGDLPYFTMILGKIDARSHRGTIIQAGHPSPLLVRSDGSVRLLGDGGFPVGLFAASTYEPLTFPFAPRDKLVLYSDGLVEAENPAGEIFSEERLLALVREHARSSTPELLEAMNAALRRWRQSDTLDDDVSVLVLERVTEALDGRLTGTALGQPTFGASERVEDSRGSR
ncbi:MAG TPA: PP2C family protein-serine/threonine phosphatase, partial [Microvirga sp.]|nr:PP2C family protein-serine/threonine phosphatase [Microvirga sp.]